jgi:ribonuclease G
VLKTLRKSLAEDRTKTFTAEISSLGLVEMTRQNVTEGVREIMSRPCPTCDGEGVIRSEETIAIEFERRLREVAKSSTVDAYLVQVNPRVSAYFTGNGARVLRELEEETSKEFHFEGSEGLPLDHFAITLEGTREEVGERALPFRIGDEVLVHIVEPHMYEMDHGVAKIDGYIISVTEGAANVGERRLVRIDQVGRTAAVASLVGGNHAGEEKAPPAKPAARGSGRGGATKTGDAAARPPARRARAPKPAESDEEAKPAEDAKPAEGEDALESPARRRGRRGGRRRSRPKAETTSE